MGLDTIVPSTLVKPLSERIIYRSNISTRLMLVLYYIPYQLKSLYLVREDANAKNTFSAEKKGFIKISETQGNGLYTPKSLS